MEIIQRNGKYFMQLANGELEISKDQFQKRVYEGAQIKHVDTDWQEVMQAREWPTRIMPKDADMYIKAGQYFDNIIKELEQIYIGAGDRQKDIGHQIVVFCMAAINQLEQMGKSDLLHRYHILSWQRILLFVQALTGNRNLNKTPSATPVFDTADVNKQVFYLLLLQEAGLFPCADSQNGVTQTDVVQLIAGILGSSLERVIVAIQEANTILMRIDTQSGNIEDRRAMVEDAEAYFSGLPYKAIHKKIKSLSNYYKKYRAE